jgi:hypothetical protein
MKKMFFISFILCTLVLTSCEQFVARNFGGDVDIKVEKGYKVTSATWKETDLFYFIEPMEEGYQPKVKKFIESSNLGVLESEVIFIESK